MASNDDIMRFLGKIEAKLEATNENLSLLRGDFSDEKDHAHESRAVIHRRLDEQQQQVAKLETTVAISGQVDAQMRDQLAGLSETVRANQKAVQPALDDWRRVKTLGWGVSGAFVAVGISAASIYAWAWDWASTALRHWLKIN